MPRWEYQIAEMTVLPPEADTSVRMEKGHYIMSYYGLRSYGFKGPSALAWLNESGAEGWELIASFPVRPGGGLPQLLLFRRSLPEEEPETPPEG